MGRLLDEYGGTTEEEDQSRSKRLDEITNEIADAMGESAADYEPDGDEADEQVARLRYFVSRLVDEYSAMKANMEGQ